jgi:Ca2+:H+ antiporter
MTAGALDAVIAAARRRAAASRHAFVGTEHLLAALLDDPNSLSTTLIGKIGLVPAELSQSLLEGLRQSADGAPVPPDGVPLSSFAQRAVEGAADESELLRRLIANPKGRIGQALRADPKAIVALRTALGVERPPAREPVKETAKEQGASPARPPREKKPSAPRPEPKPRVEPKPRPQRSPAPERPAEPPAMTAPPSERPLRLAVRPHTERRPFPWSRLLLLAVPVSIAFAATRVSPVIVFFTACLAVLPLAQVMGTATESLADRFGPTIGGLLNATFGNAAELIIAIVALKAGLVDLVKASITGSILGNLLLILGLSFIAGGGKHAVVKFNRNNAGMSAAMLALAVAGLVFPAVFHAVHEGPMSAAELRLSEVTAGILIITYLFSLLFSLRTHKALFGGGDHPDIEPTWGLWTSVLILAAATVGVVVESELLVHSVQSVTASLGWSQTFLGLVIIPLIGNAAEHATAVVVARKGQTDLAFQIALGSSTQVALLVAPLLVFIGLAMGTEMNLVFRVFEVAALAVSTIVIAIITLDGETHWFEGVQLLAVYGMMAAAAFFI